MSPAMWKQNTRICIVILLFCFFGTFAGATTINQETEVVKLGTPTTVEITIDYDDFTSTQVSTLVPANHDPQNVEGEDHTGSIECRNEGNEILCDPSVEQGNYSVTITYETQTETTIPSLYQEYTHTKRILVPTDQYKLRVILPTGHGTVDREGVQSYEPNTGTIGNENGRIFFVEWTNDDLSLTDRMSFTVRYEELAVFESFPLSSTVILILLVIIGGGAGIWFYSPRGGSDTIAAVLPVLKEDEQDVLRYMIEQDGSCEQKALVEDLSYSKAKVSRLLKDLEERNLIEKIKEGRKNRVELAKDVGDVEL